ncbi:hypothetical protein YC2023_005943 [Brassica napus]
MRVGILKHGAQRATKGYTGIHIRPGRLGTSQELIEASINQVINMEGLKRADMEKLDHLMVL